MSMARQHLEHCLVMTLGHLSYRSNVLKKGSTRHAISAYPTTCVRLAPAKSLLNDPNFKDDDMMKFQEVYD